MSSRRLAAGLLACFAFAACSDNTTSPTADKQTEIALAQANRTGPLVFQLTNLPVVRTVDRAAGTFTGTVTITSFATNAAGDLLANGTIAGTTLIGGITTPVSQAFTNLLVTTARRCAILNLDLGPIFLNLLGLELVTSPISVDLTAVAGPGNLLGNLLCALVHLLDQNPLGAAVQNLLSRINAILGTL